MDWPHIQFMLSRACWAYNDAGNAGNHGYSNYVYTTPSGPKSLSNAVVALVNGSPNLASTLIKETLNIHLLKWTSNILMIILLGVVLAAHQAVFIL